MKLSQLRVFCEIMQSGSISKLQSNTTVGSVVFRPLKEKLSYDYAILSSRFRPMSQLASQIKQEWLDEVLYLLHNVNANPVNASPEFQNRESNNQTAN